MSFKRSSRNLEFNPRLGNIPIVSDRGGLPTLIDPPNNIPGMTVVRVDTTGRLVLFEGVPPRDKVTDQPRGDFDWAGVFKEAGFDLANFKQLNRN